MADISIFMVALLQLCFRRVPKRFFTTKHFDGYLQREACTNFQKNCSWARYNYVKFFPVTSIFLVALLRFCCRKVAWEPEFLDLFYLLKRLQWFLLVKRMHPLIDAMKSNKLHSFKVYERHSKSFGHAPPFSP